MNWRWVDRRALLLLHADSLAEHGGAAGLRDEGLLDSALARPLNLAAYGEPDFAALAASYGVGLAKNHAFVDGNKRAAFLAVGLFLALNGQRLVASQVEATTTMLALAEGSLDEAGFADWIRRHTRPR
ncbi:MAG: type II toxin-antitoxin system death-on-curing family toxin [Rubrivivax sp.]|jgi:death-on-curing protein|nr:type II toxin-antitoxin system death-on-curing family toxin [Betaproteobacteria bacterium]MBP6317901.1 type II toxin-antitoxin system death-on-curing family toxin [Rubrivivax sp.]MBK7278691.1 type II toxin-antitoxin system death-on-curing family toxin [Betaproteobacteria bacterium]MBK7459790.1 type II toxin-antitoxin system death-on-curing family toxin [Betaproteobacteria bacterium]MBK7517639.1 type II toxin-antitoxin system death-on-curing family toxin [Betaproteobacteria bacterium]